MLYVDLDDFRQINQKHGDLVGSVLLREVAILIKNKIRDIDVAARLADEEFGVILPGSERMGAFLVAERIRKDVERHFLRRDTDGRPIGMTITIGVAKYPEDATIADRLLERAEQAMHQAKARGGNAVGIYYRERRNFIRFSASAGPVRIHVSPACGDGEIPELPSTLRANNISRSGLLFESDLPYAIGVALTVVCEDERDGARLTLPARVVRIEEVEGQSDRYEVGAVFLLEWEHQEAQVAEFLRRGGLTDVV
jgi:diguanylate cyclase (GGDEF)-like protein